MVPHKRLGYNVLMFLTKNTIRIHQIPDNVLIFNKLNIRFLNYLLAFYKIIGQNRKYQGIDKSNKKLNLIA